MKFIKLTKIFKILTNLKLAILILILISFFSSLGSIIEQDETLDFYKEKYPSTKPIFGFISANLITQLGLDHIYQTFWFLALLSIFSLCLISCTMTQQLPIFFNSKKYLFKQKKKSFKPLPLFIKLAKSYYSTEKILIETKKKNIYLYQKERSLYGYKGLFGRISPILVHVSLICLLLGAASGTFLGFKAQEMPLKGELFNIQNLLRTGQLAKISVNNYRINDFWIEYKKKIINQFYSDISILDNFGNEIKRQTVSVNNPIHHKAIDVYQGDWSLIGIRVKLLRENQIKEVPMLVLTNQPKSWVTCVKTENKVYVVIFNQLQNKFLIYDNQGKFLRANNIGDIIGGEFIIKEFLPATGLLLKSDPTIPLMYFGFALLMITASLSYLPYTQIWVAHTRKLIIFGSAANRDKGKADVEFETLIRSTQGKLKNTNYYY